MIRVVIDTNIVVSALLQPHGPPAEVFVLAAGNSIQLCVSGDVYAEYEEVIRRPRFSRDEEVIMSALRTIRDKSVGSSREKRYGPALIRMTIFSLSVHKRRRPLI
jgi:uncharacterized protein